jgi:hypothetical protein
MKNSRSEMCGLFGWWRIIILTAPLSARWHGHKRDILGYVSSHGLFAAALAGICVCAAGLRFFIYPARRALS